MAEQTVVSGSNVVKSEVEAILCSDGMWSVTRTDTRRYFSGDGFTFERLARYPDAPGLTAAQVLSRWEEEWGATGQ